MSDDTPAMYLERFAKGYEADCGSWSGGRMRRIAQLIRIAAQLVTTCEQNCFHIELTTAYRAAEKE